MLVEKLLFILGEDRSRRANLQLAGAFGGTFDALEIVGAALLLGGTTQLDEALCHQGLDCGFLNARQSGQGVDGGLDRSEAFHALDLDRFGFRLATLGGGGLDRLCVLEKGHLCNSAVCVSFR